MTTHVECPRCGGMGDIASHRDFTGPKGYTERETTYFLCKLCNGFGAVTEQQALDWPSS
jgi:hypothetical protein